MKKKEREEECFYPLSEASRFTGLTQFEIAELVVMGEVKPQFAGAYKSVFPLFTLSDILRIRGLTTLLKEEMQLREDLIRFAERVHRREVNNEIIRKWRSEERELLGVKMA